MLKLFVPVACFCTALANVLKLFVPEACLFVSWLDNAVHDGSFSEEKNATAVETPFSMKKTCAGSFY